MTFRKNLISRFPNLLVALIYSEINNLIKLIEIKR